MTFAILILAPMILWLALIHAMEDAPALVWRIFTVLPAIAIYLAADLAISVLTFNKWGLYLEHE